MDMADRADPEPNAGQGQNVRLETLLGDRRRFAAYLQNSAHQMRTPLTVLRSYTELVQAEFYGPVTREMSDKLETLAINLDELSYFVDQLQDMGLVAWGGVRGERGPSDLFSLLEQVNTEVSPVAKNRGITLVLERPGRMIMCDLDMSLSRKALHHLLRYVILTAPVGAEVRAALKEGPEKVLLVVFGFGELISGPEMSRVLEGMTEVEANLSNSDWERLSLPLCRTLMIAQEGDLTIFTGEGERTVYVLEFLKVP